MQDGFLGAWVHFQKRDPCRTEACTGPPHSEILCGAALPGAFFSRKNNTFKIFVFFRFSNDFLIKIDLICY